MLPEMHLDLARHRHEELVREARQHTTRRAAAEQRRAERLARRAERLAARSAARYRAVGGLAAARGRA